MLTQRCALVLIALLAACGGVLAQSPPAAPGLYQEIVPKASTAPLVNPGMGLYLMGKATPEDFSPDAWYRDLINIGYFRDDWTILQPDKEGEYRFKEYFEPIFDLWVKQLGKRVSFRFMSQNMHSRNKYVTPKWVFDAGVPSVTHTGLYVPEQIDPAFWDEKYLQIQERFIADLGKYLDGRPGLEFIDIGGIGEWGEMHLARWTSDQLVQTGYTRAKYVAAYRRMIDAYARAFPNTRVFLNVGDYAELNDYAAIRGLHFRQDGLNPKGPSANVGKLYYAPYSRRGVICNYELFSGYEDMKKKNWDVKETFDKGLEDPISYLHINLMGYAALKKAPDDVRGPVEDAARRIGFRFRPSAVRVNRVLRVSDARPGRLLIEHTWVNEGVAPCYDSYALRWTLKDGAGKTVVEEIDYPTTPTTLWWPGSQVLLKSRLTVPPGVPTGEYKLQVAMVKPEEPNLRIALALEGRSPQGDYPIATIPGVKQTAGPTTVYTEGFEDAATKWTPAAGISLKLGAQAHTGKGGLSVAGDEPGKAWSYASLNLPGPLLPGSRYRLSAWMKVDSLSTGAKAPYLKLGLVDATGKWITNLSTSAYNLNAMGTWQQVSGYIETTPETAGGHIAIEKGEMERPVSLSLHLDDVQLELVESP